VRHEPQGLFDEPLPVRRPWVTALLLGTVVTPAAVILAVPAPRPLDALLAWPLVLMDVWWNPTTPTQRLVALVLGILLTWLHYVVAVRVVLWRMGSARSP
jgi:hypothetical protein